MSRAIEMLNSPRPSPTTDDFDGWLDELEFRLCEEECPLERNTTYFIAQGPTVSGLGNNGKSENFPFYIPTVPSLGTRIRQLIQAHPEGDLRIRLKRGDEWGYSFAEIIGTGHYQTIQISNISGFTLDSYGLKTEPNPRIQGFVDKEFIMDPSWLQATGTWVQMSASGHDDVWGIYCSKYVKHVHDFADPLDETYVFCGLGAGSLSTTATPMWVTNTGNKMQAIADISGGYLERGFGFKNDSTINISVLNSNQSSGWLFVKSPNGSGGPPPNTLKFAFMPAFQGGSLQHSAINVNNAAKVRIDSIDAYGYGIFPSEGNNQNPIFHVNGGSLTSGINVVTNCNAYFSASRCFGTAGGPFQGHTTAYFDCNGGYSTLPGAVTLDQRSQVFNFFVADGGNFVARRCNADFGSIPFSGMRRGCVAFSGHTGGGSAKHRLFIVDQCVGGSGKFGPSILESVNDDNLLITTTPEDFSTYNFISRKNVLHGGYNCNFEPRNGGIYVSNKYFNLQQPVGGGGFYPFYTWGIIGAVIRKPTAFANCFWEYVRVGTYSTSQPWYILRSTSAGRADFDFINCRFDIYSQPSAGFSFSNDNNATGVMYGCRVYNSILNHTGFTGTALRLDLTWNQAPIPFITGGIANCSFLQGAWNATNSTSVEGYNNGSGVVEHQSISNLLYIPSSGDPFFEKGTKAHGFRIDFDIEGRPVPEVPSIGPVQPSISRKTLTIGSANPANIISVDNHFRTDNLGINVAPVSRRDSLLSNPWVTGAVVGEPFVDMTGQFARGIEVSTLTDTSSLHNTSGFTEITNRNRNNKGISKFSSIVETDIFIDDNIGDTSVDGTITFKGGSQDVTG